MNREPLLDAPLRLELFGGPVVREDGEIVHLTPYQLALLTLVYGHEPRGLDRPQAIWLIWEESDDAPFRQRVRQILHGIRKKAGRDLIRVTGDMLEPVPEVYSDLRRYQELLSAGQLRQAAGLCREGFASKLLGVPTPEYQDWLDAKRVRLSRLLRDAGARGWDTHYPNGNWAAAREAAEALYSLDPLNEAVVRNVMRARAMMGSGEAAQAAYSELVQALDGRRSPARETVELLERFKALTASRWSDERDTPEHIPFVGRMDAFAQARDCLAKIRHGSFEFVLVRGEAGIGKTRFIDELEQEAHVKGFRCLSARLVELEQEIPLNSLIDALNTPEVIEHIDALEEPWRAVITAILPADAEIERTTEVPYIQESGLSRRLLDSFSLLFSRLAKERPTLLFIDDLHWADATTLAVLQFVQRRWKSAPLGVVASIRPDLLSPSNEVWRYLREPSDLTVTQIDLGDLGEEEAFSLVRRVGGEDMSRDTCARICALGGCNPFYIVELTRDYQAGKLHLPEMPSDALAVPMSLQQLFEVRIERLSDAARFAAEAMAVWGRWMQLADLAALTSGSVDTCAKCVEELAGWRLVQVDRGRVRVAHELFRSTQYHRISPARRAVLHGAVAQRLLQSAEIGLEGELAVHFAKAGDAQSAVQYGRVAAKEALDSGAVAEAAHFLEIVVANEADETLRAEATADLARLLHMNRAIARANPLLELASTRLRKVGRTFRALRMEIRRVEGLAEAGATPIEDLIYRLRAIKSEAKGRHDWEAVARALDVELHLLDRIGDVGAVQSLFREMDACAATGGPEAACVANASLALNVLYGDAEEALAAARRAVRIAEEQQLEEWLLQAQTRLLMVLQYKGMLYLKEGQQLLARANAVAASSGDLAHRFHLEHNLGVFYLEARELDRADVALHRALSLMAGAEAGVAQATQFTSLGELSLQRGNFDDAVEFFEQAERLVSPTTPEFLGQLANAGLGICALETGALSEARRREANITGTPETWHYDFSSLVTLRARVMERQGRSKDAISYVSSVANGLKERFTFGWLKLRALEARIARRAGAPACVEELMRAMRRAEELSLPKWTRELRRLLDRLTA